ncbi:DUF3558 domain-containing protein [Crossiella sp. CA-258035]|uniref:DUF3558 domain-containing protein n=1 Tax=Crossiella sp. CA-258035 TaxID=2981138 RepID=UPI0024BC342E|nr:DUF3558 domain-containing protein [Crossiella sp. CA-258035]WHT20489.1 DUF3558 domain-containing protein [Crossiella sp. CA-258035]
MGGLCAALVLTGCAAVPGTPTTSSSANQHGAPPLAQPELDTAPFVPDPCRLLAEPQLAQLGVAVPGKPEDSPLGKTCRWIATDTPARIDFSLAINTQLGGLDRLYGRRNAFALWQPLEVSGYPAVIADDDDQKSGECQVNVAVSNTVLVPVGLQLKSGADQPADFADPCPRGVKILEQVVSTLKGGR